MIFNKNFYQAHFKRLHISFIKRQYFYIIKLKNSFVILYLYCKMKEICVVFLRVQPQNPLDFDFTTEFTDGYILCEH